jgi:hypothetical protein
VISAMRASSHGVSAGPPIPAASASLTARVTAWRATSSGKARSAGTGTAARGILDGDYVLINPSGEAKDGDLVAVRIGLTTVLRSADSGEAPTDDFALLGVVCGVFRPYFEQSPTPLMPVVGEVS